MNTNTCDYCEQTAENLYYYGAQMLCVDCLDEAHWERAVNVDG